MRPLVAVLLLSAVLLAPTCAAAAESSDDHAVPQRAIPWLHAGGASGFRAANSNCAGAACDTVWVGHSSAGAGGAFLGVGVGGVWDFDTDVVGTDSTQGWRFQALPYRNTTNENPILANKIASARDNGNSINHGDQNLWNTRILAGRKFIKTGVVGAWHADGMAGVKRKLNDGAEPSATPIAGARSAWCGLRESGNTHPDGLDALTGNYLNGDLLITSGGVGSLPEFPGYCDQWDQMLYKDFAGSSGSGSVSFRVRTDMSPLVDTITGGSGWLNPFADPELPANLVLNPADSLMVYVGSPTELAYDTNRRWFSEVIDLAKPYAEIFAVGGVYPVVAADTAITRGYAGLQPGTIRVVFRVKTNRVRSDQTTGFVGGYNSKQGAALVDEVSVDGGAVEGFETTAQIKARSLIADLTAPGGPWATTGRPPHQYSHIDNVLAAGLAYEDLCGAIGTPARLCNLAGNVMLPGNHDDANHRVPSGPTPATENYLLAETPTIDLAVRTAAPGTKNAQGIDQETASRTQIVLEYDFYSGDLGLDESIFYRFAARGHGPQFTAPVSGNRVWSGLHIVAGLFFNPDPLCYIDRFSLGSLGVQPGMQDSLRVGLLTLTNGYRFGGNNLGNPRGMYWDNIRVGFARAVTLPGAVGLLAHQFQDQFPWNEAVIPGDHPGFDTTAALMNSGVNITGYASEDAGAVIAGDSIVVTATSSGDGVTSGARLDLVFRIDPGPGNYTVPGDRTSALIDRDPAHPFFAHYLAGNGPFGTPGGHGSTWNRHVWNSARMDTAQANLYPILSRSLGGPVPSRWMSTLHEDDPAYATLGIEHGVCFLINPAGVANSTNIDCSGSPPAPYGAVSGVTREGTKILPDGWFTPGTHVEYFVRHSRIESPGAHATLPDTSRVLPQDPGGVADLDGDRWQSVDVLPDLWKSSRFGGAGLACMLMVDGADRRGSERAYVGAADSLGFGKNNGAKKGWVGLGPGSDPNDPAGFVAANLGQIGLNYDLYEIRGAETVEAGHPGVRLATNGGALAQKGDKSGPSPAMLANLYTQVLHFTGDVRWGTLHSTYDQSEGADDIGLYSGWLDGATAVNRRGLWLSGDDIASDMALYSQNPESGSSAFLAERFGVEFHDDDYKLLSQSTATTVGFLPVAAWAHPGRVYGFNHLCTVRADVLRLDDVSAPGATPAAYYQTLGSGTDFLASVYRPSDSNRHYRTLFDGFDLSHLRGHYANLGQIATLPGTDLGRMGWFDDAMAGYFQLCARIGPVVAIGDLPGGDGARFANLNLGATPNPAVASSRVLLRFTLAKAQPLTVRIYNAAGRQVARLEHVGLEGRNDVPWDGTLSSGARAPAGVYFYRIDGVDFGPGSAKSKMVLLGGRS